MPFRMKPSCNLRRVTTASWSPTGLKPFTSAANLSSWKGTKPEDHSTNRIKRGDTTDPQTEATKSGQEERREGNGAKDKTKSEGTTERDERSSSKKAEEEFPEAPRPIIGMGDERGRKGY